MRLGEASTGCRRGLKIAAVCSSRSIRLKFIGPATGLLLGVEPGEGVEPPSATNRVAALALSYPGTRNGPDQDEAVRPVRTKPVSAHRAQLSDLTDSSALDSAHFDARKDFRTFRQDQETKGSAPPRRHMRPSP